MKNWIVLMLIVMAQTVSAQNTIFLTANGKTRSVTLSDSAAASELMSLLQSGPIEVTMSDYGGFEKVGSLPQSFTTHDSQITTSAGDIMLYQGDKMVIFYGSNTWAYTPLGKIDNASASNVKDFLGNGSVVVTLSLIDASGVTASEVECDTDDNICDLSGRRVSGGSLSPGIYIVNRKKVVIK